MSGRILISQIDLIIGRRIRERRQSIGLTQQELADRVGLTYQQVHKYEFGSNRVSCGRIVIIAEALGVQAAYFFDNLAAGAKLAEPRPTEGSRAKMRLAARIVALEPAVVNALSEVLDAIEYGRNAKADSNG